MAEAAAVVELDIDGELTATAVAAEVGVELAIDDGTVAVVPLLSLFTAVAVTGDDVVDAEGVTSGSDEAAVGIEDPAESVCWEERFPATDVVETVPAVAAMEEDGDRMTESEETGSPILATTGELV